MPFIELHVVRISSFCYGHGADFSGEDLNSAGVKQTERFEWNFLPALALPALKIYRRSLERRT